MSNYFERIKEAFVNEEKRRGLRNTIQVNSKDLYFLLEDYEKMDAELQARFEKPFMPLEDHFRDALKALYLKNKNTENLLLLFMDILKPLIDEHNKRDLLQRIYYKGE